MPRSLSEIKFFAPISPIDPEIERNALGDPAKALVTDRPMAQTSLTNGWEAFCMHASRVFKRFLLTVVAALILAGGVLYIQASRIPVEYRPAQLSAEQRQQAVDEFWNQKILDEFGNATQRNEPFDWALSAEQLNRYLAAMDEIAAKTPMVKSGTIYRGLEKAGLAEPAAAMGDGVLTLMVRSKEYDKVLSVDLSFRFTDDGRLRVRLGEARVGRLTLPDFWVRGRLERLKEMLPTKGWADKDSAGGSDSRRLMGIPSQDVAMVLTNVLAAINEEPIRTELTWPIKKKRVRIEAIEIADNSLRMHVVPIRRKGRAR